MSRQQNRRLVYIFFVIVWLALPVISSQMVQAQQFPTKPITLVLPVGAGGSYDLPSRVLSSLAMDYLAQPIIIQFKPGGGGAIGSDFVASAAPDGYTLLMGGPGSQSIYPAIEGKSKGPDELAAVCRINYVSIIICTQPEAPFKTFREMLAWAKDNPGKMTYGNTGPWGAADLPWRQIKRITGISTKDVPHDGAGPSLMAVLGGHVMVAGLGATTALPQIAAGKLRALAVLDYERFATLPNVPTVKEEGVDVEFVLWKGILAPKATPRPIIDTIAVNIKKMVEDQFFVSTLKKVDENVSYLGPDDFSRLWRNEYESCKELGKLFKK